MKFSQITWVEDVALQHNWVSCLPWPYATAKSGYGVVGVGKSKVALVHRLVCEAAHGPPPTPSHQACHSCGVRICCNPAHLRWDTVRANAMDRIIHGTMLRGETQPNSKLTEAEVVTIRASKDKGVDIATRFGVAQSVVSEIRSGKAWKHLEDHP